MGLKYEPVAAIPSGEYEGIVTDCRLTSKTFDPARGPESVVEITIQPKWTAPNGERVLPVAMVFTPVVNGLSGLSHFLKRLDVHPAPDEEFEPVDLIGTELRFKAVTKENGFVTVLKDTVAPV